MARLPDFTVLGESTPQPQVVAPKIQSAMPEALTRTGDTLARAGEVIDETNKKWDTVAAEDALNKLQQSSAHLQYDPTDGFRNVQGGNAVGKKFYDDYIQKFNAAQQGILDSLKNPRQKEMFQERAQIADSQFRSSLLAHQSQQTEVYADNTYKDTLQTELSNIAANPMNDIIAATSRARINAATSEYAQRHGIPVDMEMQKNNDAIWNARILSVMADNPIAAQTMFKEHKSDLSANSQITLGNEVDKAVLPVEAKSIADKIIQPTGKAKDVKASLGDWLEQAGKEADKLHPNDPVFKDMVVQNVRSHANIIAANYDAVQKQAKDSLLGHALGLDGGQKAYSLDQLLSNGDMKQKWMMLDSQDQRGLLSVIDQNAKPIKEDGATMSLLFSKINSREITTAGQLFPYFDRIGSQGYDWLSKRIDEMQTPDGQKISSLRKNFFDGIKPTFDKSTLLNMDAQGAERFYEFQHYATQQEAAYRKAGKDPYVLYDPTSPEYLGLKSGSFKASLETQMNNLSATITGAKPATVPNTGIIQREPTEGQTGTSKSRKPIIFRNGKWEYQ